MESTLATGDWRDRHLERAWRISLDKSQPLLISLVPQRFEDGAWSGVPRFDREIRNVFPEIVSLCTDLPSRLFLRWLAWRRPEAVVITGNETSLLVPSRLRTIVVHHGCAQTHFDRDPQWRGLKPKRICRAQREMYRRSNRWFVSAAKWTASQFSAHYAVPLAPVIPHWVEPFERPLHKSRERKVILGDFRDFNKGRDAVERFRAQTAEFEFRPLASTYEMRHEVYADADAYLCLSLSEGGSFALCDAEAAALPLVITDVGNCEEFSEAVVIRYQDRDDFRIVAAALGRALETPRAAPFYSQFTFESWARAWQQLVQEVRSTSYRSAFTP